MEHIVYYIVLYIINYSTSTQLEDQEYPEGSFNKKKEKKKQALFLSDINRW